MLKNNHSLKRIYTTEDGYIALISVLILSAAGLAMVTTALLLSSDTLRVDLAVQQAAEARALAQACAEQSLQLMKDVLSCQDSNGQLTDSVGTCTYVSTGQGTSTCSVLATGSVGQAVSSLEVTVLQTETGLQLQSWTEVGD